MPDDKTTRRSMLQNIGLVMMGAAQGATGQPYLTNYTNIEADARRAKMQADLEKQQMEADLVQRGNYPINPSIQPAGGFDQSQMFSFNDKPWMKAPQQNYVPAFTIGDNGQMVPIITPNNPPGMVPKGTKIVTTPSGVQSKKIEDLKSVNTVVESNKVYMDSISQARSALDKITPGFVGKFKRFGLEALGKDSAELSEWQKIKKVLTDETLLNTVKTKGPISDQEMDLFKEAAANNDLGSKSKIMPVLDRMEKILSADEKSAISSFEKSYNTRYERPTSESSIQGTLPNWSSDKEKRYQELLKKRNSNATK